MTALGLLLGFGVGLLRLRRRGPAYLAATLFVEVFRDTPLIMQMFFIFFGLPAVRFVILPQAIRRMIPPLMGLFTTLVKDTSLAAIINVFELTMAARVTIERTLASFEIWLVAGALYFLITYPLSLVSQRLEQRLVAETAS